MKKQEIISVAIKVLGLYLLVMAIESLPTIGIALQGMDRMEGAQAFWYLAVSVIPLLLMCAIALYFIISTHSVVKWVSGAESDTDETKIDSPDKETGISKKAWQEIIFSALGLFFTVNALPPLVTSLVIPGNAQTIIQKVIQLWIGVFLYFGSKQLVEWMERFLGKNE